MKPITALLAAAGVIGALGATACGDDSGTLGASPTRAPTTSPPEIVASPTDDLVAFEAWFVRDGMLYEAQREGAAREPKPAESALRALMYGPAMEEVGLSTRLSARDRLAVSRVAGGVATVRADRSFFRRNPRSLRMREAQVVFTLTQYPTIRRVRFTSTRGPAPGRTFTRRSFEKLLPTIIIDEPGALFTTPSPVTISGTANVFEAALVIRIRDASGKVIARKVTMATCGTGCRGTYTASVRYSVDKTQNGTVEVFSPPVADGVEEDPVSVPVRLTRADRPAAG